MPKKKILIFIDWFLPGTKSGGPVRSCANLIDHLGKEFEFLVITRDTDYCETKAYKNIKSDAWNKKKGRPESVFYISEKNQNYIFLKNLISSTSFDVAYINGIYSRFFSIFPVFLLRNSGKPVLVAARGMLNPQAFSVKPIKKKVFISLVNLTQFYKKVSFHATNKEEAGFIKKYVAKMKGIHVAPNLPRKVKEVSLQKKQKEEEVKFISVARIAKEKGTLTTLRALSEVKTDCKVTYDIYGPIYDQDYWKKCMGIIHALPPNIKIDHKGSVQGEDVPDLLKGYHFFVMPSEGENFGHGIIEALTAGCPVIISNKTPWQKLEAQKVGWDVSLVNLVELTSALEQALAMKEDMYNEWSLNALEYSRKHVKDPQVLEANRRLFLYT